METAAENDELLLDKYFEDGKLTKDETVHGIRKGIATGNVIPVFVSFALEIVKTGQIEYIDFYALPRQVCNRSVNGTLWRKAK